MADGPEAPTEGIAYGRLFPWVRLFGAFGVASDAKKLILAAIGLIVFQFGGAAIDRVCFRPTEAQRDWFPSHPLKPAARVSGWTIYPGMVAGKTLPLEELEQELALDQPSFLDRVIAGLYAAPRRLTAPVGSLVRPFSAVFTPKSTGGEFLHAALSALWGVLVWGLFGGAIVRIALLQVTRSQSLNLSGAARFAARNALSLWGAPLCPLLGLVAFALLCAILGLLYRIPAIGATVAGALAFLPLLAGLVMTVVLVGLALGWPLMVPAVAAEGHDAFDGLSRAFAYVNQQRGRYLFYVLLAWLVGTVGLVFVDVFARLIVDLAAWGLSFSAPRETVAALWGRPDGSGPAAAAHGFWIGLVGLLAHAWIYSYFWSASSIAYLLLRHDVDGTPFHEIHLPEPVAPPVKEAVAEELGAATGA